MKVASPLRCRSVKFKAGGEIRVLRKPEDTSIRDGLRRSVDKCTEGEYGKEIVGYALVAWRKRGGVFIGYSNGPGSSVPCGGLGDYVKTMLDSEYTIRCVEDDQSS